MDRKQLTLVIAVVVIVGGALWLRHYFSPAEIVKRQLFELVASIENEKILGVMPKISRSYTDDWGGSYEALGGHVQSLMDAYDDLDIAVDIGAADVGEGEVRLGIAFVVSGSWDGARESILGTRLDPCRATLLWVEEQVGWRLKETEELDIPEHREELDARRTR